MVLETVFLVASVVLFAGAAFRARGPGFGWLVPAGLTFLAAASLVAVQTVFPGVH